MTQMTSARTVSPDGGDFEYWRNHTQIALQPVAAPSILGLYGFAGATFIVAANLAGWYGDGTTPQFLFPFAAVFGGIAQFLAGMWAYRARDALATAMHGMWGSFWIGYGILFLLVATGALTGPSPFVALGFWFIALALPELPRRAGSSRPPGPAPGSARTHSWVKKAAAAKTT